MQHRQCAGHGGFRMYGRCGLVGLALVLTGCGPDPVVKRLDDGARAVESGRPEETIAASDAYLAKYPNGDAAVRALYLRGRAYETRKARTEAEAAANLRTARDSYTRALSKNPTVGEQVYLRSALANVAFFQEDYATAVDQWTTALADITDPNTRMWTLFRIGLSQQRLGRFQQADQMFTRVQQEYPGTPAATQAREKQGARSFFVQLGAYSTDANARAALDAARKAGVPVNLYKEGRLIVLRAGPVTNYAQAKQLKSWLGAKYGDSRIIP